jgi:hypothetical protein
MRIFLDANIMFSAVKSDGAVHAFVAMLLDVGHECWVEGASHQMLVGNVRPLGPKSTAFQKGS